MVKAQAQLDLPGMEVCLRTAAERKQFIQDRLAGLEWRQEIRELKRAWKRRRERNRRSMVNEMR